MKVRVKKQVGDAVLEFETEEGKAKDILFQAGFVASTPDTCDVCQSKEVQLSSNKAQGYSFIKVVCKKCSAQAQMGEYKDGGYYWKRFEKYEAKDSQVNPKTDEADGVDDIDF